MKFPDWINVFGDQEFRGKCQHEEVEQKVSVSFINTNYKDLASVMIHPKNEGKRTHKQASKERSMGGLNKGASDLIFPISPSLIIEIKRRDHTLSRWEDGQIDYLKSASDQGAFTCVALGHEGVIEAIEYYYDNIFNKL